MDRHIYKLGITLKVKRSKPEDTILKATIIIFTVK